MNPNDRLFGCEGLGFPAVSNYDYETNIPNRGIEDRSFRWEEVAVESIYLLKEATHSGSFEDNYVFGSPITGIHTGVTFITTGQISQSVGYNGWTITGNSSIFIGISGVFVNSGDLFNVTSSFQAHPLDGDNAIGLHCGSGQYPKIISESLVTGLEGPIILNGRHQVYLKAKLNYGSTGAIHAYMRGYSAGSIVAYYNPVASTWDLTAPTGKFNLSTSGVTTVKYDFYANTFPAATPTSFDLFVANPTTGTFVTIDDVHVDAYLKKNAFLDFIVPTGYLIQVTPDLGWHNILSMFDSDQDLPNPHIKTLGPYQIELGNLTDNLDNTVTAVVDQDDFLQAITTNFAKYYWRAVPVNPNGQAGPAGLPVRFNYISNQINELFNIGEVIQDDLSNLKVVIGTKSKDMIIVVDGDTNHPGMSYPTSTTWRLEILLAGPSKTLQIYAQDSGGSVSSIKTIELTNKLYSQNSTALWNVFDEHGLVADIERLPDESNYDYSLRIKDVYKNRGGSNFIGIVNGATRELGLTKVPNGLEINILRNQYNVLRIPTISITMTSYSLRVFSSSFSTTERLLVDPIYSTINLTYLPVDLPTNLTIEGVGKIDSKYIEVLPFKEDEEHKYQIKINHPLALGKFVEIKYDYYLEYLFKVYRTLQDLVVALNQITDPSGYNILSCYISDLLSGNEDSLGLYIGLYSTNGSKVSIPWSPIYLKRISDRGYRDYFVLNGETIKNTDYYSYVKELKNNTRIFWGAVEADRDRWDSADSKQLSMDSIPTLFDPPLTNMLTTKTGQQVRVEAVNAWARNYLGFNNDYLRNVGLSPDYFHPGVAHKNDLLPDLYMTTSSLSGNAALESNIGPARNDNNFIVFSGQR